MGDYDKCHALVDNRDEAKATKAADRIDVISFLEEVLLRGQTEDAGDVTEEALDATRLLVTVVGHDVRISKKTYLNLV